MLCFQSPMPEALADVASRAAALKDARAHRAAAERIRLMAIAQANRATDDLMAAERELSQALERLTDPGPGEALADKPEAALEALDTLAGEPEPEPMPNAARYREDFAAHLARSAFDPDATDLAEPIRADVATGEDLTAAEWIEGRAAKLEAADLAHQVLARQAAAAARVAAQIQRATDRDPHRRSFWGP